MSGLYEVMVALPDGTLRQPQAFHAAIYDTFLPKDGQRDFLFKGIRLAGEVAVVRSRRFADAFPTQARPMTYAPDRDDYDFHLTAAPQRRDRATQKLQFLPADDGNRNHILWLRRKAGECGFALTGDMACERRIRRVPEKGSLSIDECEFSGRLMVTDHARFLTALEHGIGPRGAYGYGLLTLY